MSKNSTGTNSATNRSGSNRVSDCYSNKSENRTSNKSVNKTSDKTEDRVSDKAGDETKCIKLHNIIKNRLHEGQRVICFLMKTAYSGGYCERF